MNLPGLPGIPLPEPAFEVTVTSRAQLHALRLLLWGVPSCAVDYVLAGWDHGRHALWLTLAAAFLVLAIAVLTVGPREEGPE